MDDMSIGNVILGLVVVGAAAASALLGLLVFFALGILQ
jgi:hypothetical protein